VNCLPAEGSLVRITFQDIFFMRKHKHFKRVGLVIKSRVNNFFDLVVLVLVDGELVEYHISDLTHFGE